MIDITYTLKEDSTLSTLEIARWVKSKTPDCSTPRAIQIARVLKNGGYWQPPIPGLVNYQDAGPCEYVITPDPESPWEIQDREDQRLCKLAEDGANGDTQAAIDFCTAWREGKLHHFGAPRG